MAHQHPDVQPSIPWFRFTSRLRELCLRSAGCTILYEHHIGMDVIRFHRFADEIDRMLSILPYHRVFMIDEPCYEELITEFNTSFEFHDSHVLF